MHKRVILSVEEDDAAFQLLKAAFEEAQPEAQLFRATDGEQALAFLRREESFAQVPKPDLILLNVNPPSKSGLDVLAEIASNESLRSIKVVVMTPSPLQGDREKYLALGAQDLLNKPAKFEELVVAVRSASAKASGS